jgi:NAD(P)-dependent dehydrogenase (short-subunit alcohol dehydrogenase family)
MELKDKVVVITGGSKGFGRALAELFVEEGSKVIICAKHRGVEKVGEDLGVIGFRANVVQEDDVTTLAEYAVNKFGKIDIWINNAGIWMEGAPEDADMNQVKKMFDVNVIGTINGTRVALEHMKERNSGAIVNVISKVALGIRPKLSMYVATKYALNGFTKTIREEYKDTKISFLSVFPGGMRTELFNKSKPANYEEYMDPKVAASQVIENLKKENPNPELLILKEGEKILQENAK